MYQLYMTLLYRYHIFKKDFGIKKYLRKMNLKNI